MIDLLFASEPIDEGMPSPNNSQVIRSKAGRASLAAKRRDT
jgi:hypothetical protein